MLADFCKNPATRQGLIQALREERDGLEETANRMAKEALFDPERRAAALAAHGQSRYVADLLGYVENKTGE